MKILQADNTPESSKQPSITSFEKLAVVRKLFESEN